MLSLMATLYLLMVGTHHRYCQPVRLFPREQNRLQVFAAAELARRRRARGLLLSQAEAVALICDEVMEAARDGLDYAAVGPEHAWLRDLGRTEYGYVSDVEALEGFTLLARLEGILPALESAHAIAYTSRMLHELPEGSIVLVNLSGRGDKDVQSVAEALAR